MSKDLIAALAAFGILALLWEILPHWVLGITSLFGIALFLFLRAQLDKDKHKHSPTLMHQMEKPFVIANDNLSRFKSYNGKTIAEIDFETPLVDFWIRTSPSGLGYDSLILETKIESILFPFAIGFDKSIFDSDSIADCYFKVMPITGADNSNFVEEYICFGHPINFLNL